MKLELLNGKFNSNEAIELLTQMMQLKIKYHENKISKATSEEDIKFRETKIKNLQKQLYEFKKSIGDKETNVHLNAIVHLEM